MKQNDRCDVVVQEDPTQNYPYLAAARLSSDPLAGGHFQDNHVVTPVAEMEIYQAGELTVIGFGGREFLDHLNLADCYAEILQLLEDSDCQNLALDLTGIRLTPTGLLGLLLSVHRRSISVMLFNASTDIREVLQLTNLHEFVQLYEVEL